MRALVILALLAGVAHADDEPGAEDLAPKQEPWNQIDLKVVTVRFGAGFLYDWATYQQDAAAEAALPLSADEKVRDLRVLLKGTFPWWPRASYSIGYMYDGPTAQWRWRQTGLKVDFPEVDGDVFIGRQKEPFSTNKMMVGYYGWTMERSSASDAFLPILADGVRWTGRLFTNHMVYGVGWFGDQWSETESFNKNDQQVAARAVFLPHGADTTDQVLHFAVAGRFADSNNGSLRFRAKPESFLAQEYVVDTGKFPADSSVTVGLEAYYQPGSLMFGAEYYLNKVQSGATGDPLFHGGEALASYLFTGERHPYNPKAAIFGAVVPDRSIYSGGLGAFEGVVRVSYIDLDAGTIQGGRFWRVTPMVNWYLSPNVRLEAAYGYGRFDRSGSWESTQFFQLRMQLTLD
jgi:phosphate-selective porin OprO/OprP